MKLPNVALYNFKKSSLGERKLLKKTLVDFYNANFLLSQWSEKYFNIFSATSKSEMTPSTNGCITCK